MLHTSIKILGELTSAGLKPIKSNALVPSNLDVKATNIQDFMYLL